MSDLLIGTSGYDYPEWKGVFYPKDLKRKDFLSYYATQFNALELNNTFYNMPTAERIMSFYKRSEGRLNFSVKANRLLTHEIGADWKTAAEDFKVALKPLNEKECLSAVLFQFPESFHYTKDNRIYLAKLIGEFEGFPVMVEFRHIEWIRDSVFEGLEKRKAGIVFCDMPMCHLAQMSIISNYANGTKRRMPQLKNLPDGTVMGTPFIGENAYIRLHGRNERAWYAHVPKVQRSITYTHANGEKETYTVEKSPNGSARYCYDYSDNELSQFVPIIKAADREGKRVQVYFNNHPNGSGAKNAISLKKMIEMLSLASL